MHEKSPFTFQVINLWQINDYCDVGVVDDDDDDNYDDTQDFFKQRKRWMQGIYLVCRFHAIIITITT